MRAARTESGPGFLIQTSQTFRPLRMVGMRLESCTPQEFAKITRRIRKYVKLPPGLRIRFYYAEPDPDDPSYMGWTERMGKVTYCVHVFCQYMTVYQAVDIILHELAHVLDWHERGEYSLGDDHGLNFGKHWAYVYRSWYESPS